MSSAPVATPLAANPALRGSPEQILAALYERNFDAIYRFCRRRLRGQSEAEDAAQTTFLYALRALRRGVVPIAETAWLYKIAENVCYSAGRSRGRRSEHDNADGSDAIDRVPAHDGDHDRLLGLRTALDALPPNQRDAFLLRELQGLTYREIAVELGVSVSSVEALLFRARGRIARQLDEGVGLRPRARAALDLGSLAGALKSVVSGTGAAKLAATAALVAVAAVPAGDAPRPAATVGAAEAPVRAVIAPARTETSRQPSRAKGPQVAEAARNDRRPPAVGRVKGSPRGTVVPRARREDIAPRADTPSGAGEDAPARAAPGAPAQPVAPSPAAEGLVPQPPPASVPVPAPPIPPLPKPEVPDPLDVVPSVPPAPLPPVEVPRLPDDDLPLPDLL